MTAPLRTVLIGAGNVGSSYASDPVMAKHYPYATHAQVLSAHPGFAWEAVVDRSEDAARAAADRWGVPVAVTDVEHLSGRCEPEVAVLAVPPGGRAALLEALPTLRAVVAEKPLGSSLADAAKFVEYCDVRGCLLQVNLWRRADAGTRALAAGRLEELVGKPQVVFGLYGNGFRNNGTHMIDLIRMILGEIRSLHAMPAPDDREEPEPSFCMRVGTDVVASMHPLSFAHYRENGLDIWGTTGRLSILQEGLQPVRYPRRANRAMQGEWEVASDAPEVLPSTVGVAMYEMYDNLHEAVHGRASLWSPGGSALETTRVVEAVIESARTGREAVL